MLLGTIFALIVGYLLGSTPSAYLIGRLNGIDIFKIGSGNMGATNVLRALGFKWAALVWLIDTGKGVLAVLLARAFPGDPLMNSVAGGLAAVCGHNWSLFVRLITGQLRGGKGAATAGGTWLAVFSPFIHLILLPLSVMVAMTLATRIISLSVLATAVSALILAILFVTGTGNSYLYAVYALLIVALVFYRHRENIQRLREGRERRLGERA